jgi:hypothetical protein
LSGSPATVGCGSGGRVSTGWWRSPAPRYRPRRLLWARQVLADDLVLLADLDPQVLAAEAHMARLLPDTPFAPLISVPGWGTVRAANYGRPALWLAAAGPRQEGAA